MATSPTPAYPGVAIPGATWPSRVDVSTGPPPATTVRTDGWSAVLTDSEPTIRVRFRGVVTDLTSQPAGDILQTQVTATGMLAQFGDRYVGDVPWPVETDAARVNRIAALLPAADSFVPNGTDALSIAARDVDRKKVLEVIQAQAGWTAGLVTEDPDGTIRYDNADNRGLNEGTPLFLAGTQIVADSEWSQQKGRYVERVIVEYGPPVQEGDKPTYSTGFGAETKIDTELADLASATIMGDLVLRRWSDKDVWDAPAVHTTSLLLDASLLQALASIVPGDVIETEYMGAEPAIQGPTGKWFVEGWTETWNRVGADSILTVDMVLSVTDYARFTVAGAPVNLTAEVNPQSWTFGDPGVVLTARMDPGVNAGEVTPYHNGQQIAAPKVPVNGVASWTLAGTEIPVGTNKEIVVSYEGVWAQWQQEQVSVFVTVAQPTTVALSFSATPTTVNSGAVVTLSATVSLPGGGAAPGSVRWEYAQASSGPWTAWYSTTLANGKATAKWTSNNPDRTWYWRAVYVPASGSGISPATSAAILVNVLKKTTKTVSYNANDSASYQADGSDRGVAEMYQGYYSSNNGDQRSVATFPAMASAWSGWTITKVEVYLKNLHSYQNSGVTARIGSHTYTTPPGSNPSITRRQDVSFTKGQGKWVDITSWGKGFATGSLKGIGLGPAGSSSQSWYGYFAGNGQSGEPVIRITGYKWV